MPFPKQPLPPCTPHSRRSLLSTLFSKPHTPDPERDALLPPSRDPQRNPIAKISMTLLSPIFESDEEAQDLWELFNPSTPRDNAETCAWDGRWWDWGWERHDIVCCMFYLVVISVVLNADIVFDRLGWINTGVVEREERGVVGASGSGESARFALPSWAWKMVLGS